MGTDSPFTSWLLFDADRERLALVALLGVFSFLFALGQAGVLSLTSSDQVDTIAGGLVPGLFTFLSIVLAINQLVLSQSSGTADQVSDRVAEVREFREEVERRADERPSPLAPTRFLSVLVETIIAKATALERDADETRSQADEAAVAYADSLRVAGERADRRVQRSDPGRANAVISLLDFDDARRLYEARRLLTEHGEALSPESRQTIRELADVLELFDVARTHFRTTYTQRTLARLSRLLLYLGLPAILATFVLGLSSFDGIGGWRQVAVVSLLLTVALSPLALLSSYILRIAAVSERTVGVGPFISRPGSGDTLSHDESRTSHSSPESAEASERRRDGVAGDRTRSERSEFAQSDDEG